MLGREPPREQSCARWATHGGVARGLGKGQAVLLQPRETEQIRLAPPGREILNLTHLVNDEDDDVLAFEVLDLQLRIACPVCQTRKDAQQKDADAQDSDEERGRCHRFLVANLPVRGHW